MGLGQDPTRNPLRVLSPCAQPFSGILLPQPTPCLT